MATQRAVPGANLSESSSAAGRKARNNDVNTPPTGTGPDIAGELPGETGLGSGLGAGTSGIGSDAFGTTGGSRAGQAAPREFPRPAGVMDQMKQQASTRVNEQKARAAEGLGSVASAIRQASEHLRTENQTLASYADKAVDQIQLFADRMRDKDPAEMMRDAERFARRNPAAFVGGAFVVGLALARFLKSSGSADTHREFDHHHEDYRGASSYGFGDRGASVGSTQRSELPGSIGTSTVDPAPGITS